MTSNIREELKKELTLRGYRGRMAPHETMWLDDEDQLVARREKITRGAQCS